MNLRFEVSDDGNVAAKIRMEQGESDFSYSTFIVQLFNKVPLDASEYDSKIKPDDQTKLDNLIAEIVAAVTMKEPAKE